MTASHLPRPAEPRMIPWSQWSELDYGDREPWYGTGLTIGDLWEMSRSPGFYVTDDGIPVPRSAVRDAHDADARSHRQNGTPKRPLRQIIREIVWSKKLHRLPRVKVLTFFDSTVPFPNWIFQEPRQPRATRAHYVNIYCEDRAYGGPEEGGWWFDANYPVESRKVSKGRARQELKAAEAECRERNAESNTDLGSVHSEGRWFAVIERHPATRLGSRPRYE